MDKSNNKIKKKHIVRCPLCDKEMRLKISGYLKFYTCFCKKCGAQFSMRGKIGKKLFLEKYVDEI